MKKIHNLNDRIITIDFDDYFPSLPCLFLILYNV